VGCDIEAFHECWGKQKNKKQKMMERMAEKKMGTKEKEKSTRKEKSERKG